MESIVSDVKQAARILESGLERTSVREDFGQVVVCLESKYFDPSIERRLEGLRLDVAGRYSGGAQLRFDSVSRRVYFLAPEKTDDGRMVDYTILRDALKQAGIKVVR